MASAPRLPFSSTQQLRPQLGAPVPGSPAQRQPMPQGMTNQQRPMAPMRRVDSQGNVLPNTGQPPRPGMPTQQIRMPSNPGNTSPPNNMTPRQPGSYPWAGSGGQQNRPQNVFANQPPNQGGRPFPRPGVGGGQPQFRPPYPQQNPQFHQQQSSQQQPQQFQQRTLPPQPSNLMSRTSSHDDDDSDVVFGQAITPNKTSTINALSRKLDQGSDEGKTVQPTADSMAIRNTSFGEFNGKKQLKNIQEEHVKSKTDELAAYEPNSSNLTNLTNFQKINKDVPEKAIKPNKVESSKVFESPDEPTKGDNDSGVDESTQEKERNGQTSPSSPANTATKPTSGISRPPSATPSNKSNKSRSASRSRLALKTPEPDSTKKVPMNKIQVGNAPSPNLKAVRSKIGSLDNATYKPGGGKVKIESKKIEIKAAPRIEAKNEKYTPKGGDKKIVSTKLQWNAKSKIGSLENTNHKPGGGDKKIDTIKADFKDKAKPKVGSKDNVKYAPGGGDIKIQTHKLEIKAQSKIGSLDNVKHKPGGGDKKIFDDKDYLKNVEHPVALTSPSQSPLPSSMTTSTTGADENLNQQQQQQQPA